MTSQSEKIRPPFRIMPSRPRDLRAPAAIALLGLVLGIAGGWGVPGGLYLLGMVWLVVGVALLAWGIFSFLCERKYFDPLNNYWIEIGLDDFALVMPDAVNRQRWTSLPAFEVKATEHRHKHRRTVTYETIARGDGVLVGIPLRDFATRLGYGQDRAERMCSILNALRQDALSRQPGSAGELYQVPRGLVVAPMAPAARKSLVPAGSVVQRQ